MLSQRYITAYPTPMLCLRYAYRISPLHLRYINVSSPLHLRYIKRRVKDALGGPKECSSLIWVVSFTSYDCSKLTG